MADNLKPLGSPAPAPHRDGGRLGRRGELALALLAALCLAAALGLGWRAFIYREEGDPVASAMQMFEKQNDLIVLTYRTEVVADAKIEGPLGLSLLERRQTVIVPAMIDYRIPLGDVDAADMSWDKERQVLTLTLPPLQTSRPNLDEGKARIFSDGFWATGDDAVRLLRKNSQVAERKAADYAKDRQVLDIARAAAREAVARNLIVPLQVAGYDNAQVMVRFEDEP